MNVQVVESVLKLNDELAAMNRNDLRSRGLFCIDLMGAPGCGKTSLVEATLQRLAPGRKAGVIVGDLATQRDADRIARHTDRVVQINTGKTCHLEANHVRQAMSRISLDSLDLLIIENVGNLICPVGFDLGQDVKVGMFSVAEGDDKPAKHPYIVKESAVLVLSKIDLLPHMPFDLELFRRDVQAINPGVELIELSTRSGKGMGRWMEWLSSGARKKLDA